MQYKWNQYDAFVRTKLEEADVPGASICVRDESGVLYENTFGFCDEQHKVPVSADTVFGIASMSKSVTCLCAALLEREGKLSFDHPVTRYLPDFKIPGTPSEAVQVRHLANHTTGLPPLPLLSWSMKHNTQDDPWLVEIGDEIRAQSRSKVTCVKDILDFVAGEGNYRVLGQPGQFMSYLNDGYALLSAIIDVASGETLESYAERNIFEPLGMTRTTFDLERVKAREKYTSLFIKMNGELKCSDIWDVAPPYRGCGWIKSTAGEMCRYYQMLSCNGLFEGRRIVPQSCVSRVIGREFPEIARGTYCFGLAKRLFEDVAICEHSGGLKGVSSRGGFIKDAGFSVTLLTNLTDVDCSPITNAAFNVRLGLPLESSHAWAKPTGELVQEQDCYVGRYVSHEDPGAEINIELDELGRLSWKENGKTLDMLFCGTTVFVVIPEGKTVAQAIPMTFYVNDGKAWGVQFGSRVFQREEAPVK